ncbi:hypothetical protein CCACVL1_16087 [Corchorus capsularis]|uniref:Uncharacterized protein n=1 Tax=Corchorus capsularis TaxID=210143 RepID=A0A1R3HZA4_COCAP|nr:hypothetical protein CCACVL1_16087 [Corchorus capsularis]
MEANEPQDATIFNFSPRKANEGQNIAASEPLDAAKWRRLNP